MPKLRVLSGADLVKIFKNFGFVVVFQKGSHAKLRRMMHDSHQTLTIPIHKNVEKGTTKAIYNQAKAFIPEADLKGYFLTEWCKKKKPRVCG